MGQPEWDQLPGVLEAIQWPLCTETWSSLCLYYILLCHNASAENLLFCFSKEEMGVRGHE